MQINWTEPLMLGLAAFHLSTLALVILTRKEVKLQASIAVILGGWCLSSGPPPHTPIAAFQRRITISAMAKLFGSGQYVDMCCDDRYVGVCCSVPQRVRSDTLAVRTTCHAYRACAVSGWCQLLCRAGHAWAVAVKEHRLPAFLISHVSPSSGAAVRLPPSSISIPAACSSRWYFRCPW